jgi:hypothetical protein
MHHIWHIETKSSYFGYQSQCDSVTKLMTTNPSVILLQSWWLPIPVWFCYKADDYQSQCGSVTKLMTTNPSVVLLQSWWLPIPVWFRYKADDYQSQCGSVTKLKHCNLPSTARFLIFIYIFYKIVLWVYYATS